MKRIAYLAGWCLITACLSFDLRAGEATQRDAEKSAPIPLYQLGTVAQKQYSGEGLSISATEGGARLRCVFQKLDACATSEGLWISSTAENSCGKRFRVVAASLCRDAFLPNVERGGPAARLPALGTVEVANNLVRFIRPGLTEEYSVSMDGVRQDFLIDTRPPGEAQLRVELSLDGAIAESSSEGARLILAGNGRKIAYNRMHATDAQGKELSAKLEVVAANRLAVLLDDAGAQYPVRIDPTFSDDNWVSFGGLPGADGWVRAAAVDEADNLYIGGGFNFVCNTEARNIAKWDGSHWSALGSGVNSRVDALALWNGALYAGGEFTNASGVSANHIAKWNGNTWEPLGSGMNDTVCALAASGTNLYAGGWFSTAGGTSANFIAKWDGSSWSALGSGMNREVLALAISGSHLYAGGSFTNAGGISANYIAHWDGNAWSGLGSGMGSDVYVPQYKPLVCALATSGTSLYVGGYFGSAGGISANNVAKWNGTNWSALGEGIYLNDRVKALAVSGTNLYVGGNFWAASIGRNIAKWNGIAWESWQPSGSGLGGEVLALAVRGSNLYAGGSFSVAGPLSYKGGILVPTAAVVPANCIAKWDGANWAAIGEPATGVRGVSAIAVSGSNLYVGGGFDVAGSTLAKRIAKWNGINWSNFERGFDYDVCAIALFNGELYAGGRFYDQSRTLRWLAKWDESVRAWNPTVGWDLNGHVQALAVAGNRLYAGGTFTSLGSHIARFDGANWSALGSGVDGNVCALAASGSFVYAGGFFTNAGGIPASYIAKWNGSAWQSLGTGMDGPVYALAAQGNDLFAGGAFTTAGGVSARRIAKWNGNGWSALGSGMNLDVYALTLSGSNLFAGGDFTQAGGVSASYIARWNGNQWGALGLGVDGRVTALAMSGNDCYAGGWFSKAGGKVSFGLARLANANFPNTAPIASAQSVVVAQGVATPITLFGSDPDNDPINYVLVSRPTNGVLTGTPPCVTYRPNAGFDGTDSFLFKVIDGNLDSPPTTVSITILGPSHDTDGDGLSDAAEYRLSALGFDWQVGQPALVSALFDGANSAGLYTQTQLRALAVGSPLLERDGISGSFTITLGLEQSTNLVDFVPLPLSAQQITINPDGQVEFRVPSQEGATFFRLEAH